MDCLNNIYSLSDPETGLVKYIGKTSGKIELRLCSHVSESKKNNDTYKNIWIRSLLKKGLKPKVELIDSVNDWVFWEQHYISLYKSWGFKLTNLCDGGRGGSGLKQSIETIEKRTRRGKDHYNFGQKKSEEFKKKLSDAHKGKKLSKETCLKMSERMKKNHPMKGKPLTEDHKRKLWLNRVRENTPETKLKKSIAVKKWWAERRSKSTV